LDKWENTLNTTCQCFITHGCIEYTMSMVEVNVTSSTPRQSWRSRLHLAHIVNCGSQGYINYTSSKEGVNLTNIRGYR